MTQEECDRRTWSVLETIPRSHPFVLFNLPQQRRNNCRDIHPGHAGRRVVLVVWCITRKQVRSYQRRGRDGEELAEPIIRPMAFVTLEDEFAIAESVWFADAYARSGIVLERGEPFWVSGEVTLDHGVAILTVERAWPAVAPRSVS